MDKATILEKLNAAIPFPVVGASEGSVEIDAAVDALHAAQSQVVMGADGVAALPIATIIALILQLLPILQNSLPAVLELLKQIFG